MAKYIATTDGNWSTVGTWSTGTNTPTNHASTRITIDGAKYTDTFTAPNTTNACLGVIINISAVATSGYSYVVTLQENTVDTAATKTIAVADLAVGAYYVEFTTPYVFTSTTAGYYRFKVDRSGSGSGSTTVVSNSAGTLVAFQAVDNRNPASAPTTGDDVWIIGPNETGTSTVTVDGTCLVGSLTDAAAARSIYYMNQACYIGRGGLLKWDTSASATLTVKGQLMVTGALTNKGELQIGTVASPYPLAYTAKLRFDPNGTSGASTMGCAGYGRVQLHGYPITGTTNWKTLYASGAGSVADPMVVDDAVNWATGSEVLVCTTGAGIHSNYTRHQNELCDITKVNATTYSLVSKREIENADFEGVITGGWTSSAGTGAIAADATTYHAGKQSAKLTAGSSYNTNIYQSIFTNPGKSVTLKFWTRGDGTYEGRYQIYSVSGSTNIVATKGTGVTGTTWTEVSETFTVPASCYEVRIYLHCPGTNTGIAYFDDVSATVDGLMYSHSDNARVLYMTRNVVVESISFKEGVIAGMNSYISGDIDYDWIRINNAYGSMVGGYAPNGAWYHACDYSVLYNNQRNDMSSFYCQYHAEYNMYPETFTGNIVYNAAFFGFNIGQINKTLVDCFSIYCSYGGFYAVNGSTTMTRCISISDNRSNLGAYAAYVIGGSAILMTDCEAQSTGLRAIITAASCTGKLVRFKSGTLGGNNSIYTGDLTANRLFNNIAFEDCIFQYAIPTYNNLAPNTTDSEWRVSNYNDVDTVDMVIKPMGYRYRTGSGLTDTTVHTGGYAVRFQPTSSTIPLNWDFSIYTGNIQTYQATFSVWVKINNAAYYAGTHQNPKLTVNYDNGTLATNTATDTTDWQQLSVSFTPTTTYGQVYVTIDGFTDATTTNAYFYVDDMELAYPSGYAVNLGKLDVWASANPITPSSDTTGYLSYDWTQDPYVTHTEAQANALSGIALDYEDKTITVSESHTLTELYEYCKASSRTNGVIQALSTKDGITYKLAGGWTLIQGANVDITETPFLDLNGTTLAFPTDGSMVPTLINGSITLATPGTITCNMNGISIDYQDDGTYNHAGSTTNGTITLDTSTSSTVTAQFAPGTTVNNLDEVNITVESAASVDITVNNIVAGSRIQIYNLDDEVEMYNEIVAGTTWTDSITYTEDVNVRIRLMYVDGVNAYKWYTATATITSTGFNINAAQEVNTVYEDNNIDGSTVTECSVSGATIRIYVDDPDNTTTAQRIYNWYQYYLFTEAGIREQDGTYVTATDQTHYVFADTMKIVNEDTSNPLNITGANIVPQTGASTNIFDLTNGASIALNFNRVEGFSYSSGSGLSTEEHDTLLAIDTAIDTNLDAKVSTVKPSLLVGGKVII